MGPRFDKIALLGNGDLLVEGPFETHGEVVDDVVVRILIVTDASTTRALQHGDSAQFCSDDVRHQDR